MPPSTLMKPVAGVSGEVWLVIGVVSMILQSLTTITVAVIAAWAKFKGKPEASPIGCNLTTDDARQLREGTCPFDDEAPRQLTSLRGTVEAADADGIPRIATMRHQVAETYRLQQESTASQKRAEASLKHIEEQLPEALAYLETIAEGAG